MTIRKGQYGVQDELDRMGRMYKVPSLDTEAFRRMMIAEFGQFFPQAPEFNIKDRTKFERTNS